VNTSLLPAITAALRPGGLAVFSGMEEQEAAEFRRILGAAGFRTCDEAADAGWWAVAAARS
jgi:ribosomal protein L11 methylase PrmA